MQIGQVIRVLRTERGATLESLAFEAGTDASNLSRIERGVQRKRVSNYALAPVAEL